MGCQKTDADAFCKLKLCDQDAFSTYYEETRATEVPGFACDRRGEDYGDWLGIESVHFDENTKQANGFALVVSNVTCETGKYHYYYY